MRNVNFFEDCLGIICQPLKKPCSNYIETLQCYYGEQTYCRKWIFDKTPKIVLGHNGEKIFPKYRLGTKRRIFFILIWSVFVANLSKKIILLISKWYPLKIFRSSKLQCCLFLRCTHDKWWPKLSCVCIFKRALLFVLQAEIFNSRQMYKSQTESEIINILSIMLCFSIKVYLFLNFNNKKWPVESETNFWHFWLTLAFAFYSLV